MNGRVKQSNWLRAQRCTNTICQVFRVVSFTCSVYVYLCSSFHTALAQQVDIARPATADFFLKQLVTAEHKGMGGSFVGFTSGANALNSNPAGLSVIDENRFVLHTARFPRTVAVVSRLNAAERYEDYSRYDVRASGIELINYAMPVKHLGIIGIGFARGHDGKFSRVDRFGKATNRFPQGDWVFGIGYGAELLRGLAIGLDARWLRSQVQSAENDDHVGYGYAYSLGAIRKISDYLQVGVSIRNLSNGLSFSDNSIPDRIERDVLVGAAYLYCHKAFDLKVGLDFNPPFEDGLRVKAGAELCYLNRLVGRFGYLRHTENRWNTIRIVETDMNQVEERVWKTDGVTFGIGVNLGPIRINGAYTPQARPTGKDGDQIRVDRGGPIYFFSIGQGL